MLVTASPAGAASNNVQISNLSDVVVGAIPNISADTVRSQNVCVFSQTATNGYNIRASGSGASSALTLASGGNLMAYEVQWSSTAGASSGADLSSGGTLTGQTSTAANKSCGGSGPSTTATLFVIIRAAAASAATAGDYAGTLTLVVGAE